MSLVEFDIWDFGLGGDPPADVRERTSGLHHLQQYLSTRQPMLLDSAINHYESAQKLILENEKKRLECAHNLGYAYLLRYYEHEEREDHTRAIDYLSQACNEMGNDPFYEMHGLETLGLTYWALFDCSGATDYTDLAVGCFERAISLTSDDTPTKAKMLDDMAGRYANLFQWEKKREYAEKAVACLRKANMLTQESQPEKPGRLYRLGEAFKLLDDGMEHHPDIIEYTEQAISLTPNDDPNKVQCLLNLSQWCTLQAEELHIWEYTDKAIGYLNLAIALMPEDDSRRAKCMLAIGLIYKLRFERQGSHKQLEDSIYWYRQAASIVTGVGPDIAVVYTHIGSAYRDLFESCGSEEHLGNIVHYYEKALSSTPEGDFQMPQRLIDLGSAKAWLCYQTGQQAQLEQSFKFVEKAASLISHDHKKDPLIHAELLEGMGSAYNNMLFNQSGTVEHVKKAVGYLELAVKLTPPTHARRTRRLSNLASSYGSLYRRLGQWRHLKKALSYLEEATCASPGSHFEQAIKMRNLSDTYYELFACAGVLKYLDKSISYGEEAVRLTLEDSPERVTVLISLGRSYLRLSDCLREPRTAHTGLKYLEQALLLTPEEDTRKIELLQEFGDMYRLLYRQTAELNYLDKARSYIGHATSLALDSGLEKAELLYTLGIINILSFQNSNTTQSSIEAVECLERALSLLPQDSPLRPSLLKSLGEIYMLKFLRHGTQEHAETSMDFIEQAIESTQEDHPQRPFFMYLLGGILLSVSTKYPSKDRIEKALRLSKSAALSNAGELGIRLSAASQWSRVSKALGLCPLEAHSYAMKLLPRIVWLGTPASSRYNSIKSDIRNAVSAATSAALLARRSDLAIEWLEQGRCFIWNQRLQLRTPVDDLRVLYPELAEELESISSSLNNTSTSRLDESDFIYTRQSLHEAAQTHRRLAERREEIIEIVRGLANFEDFLQEPTISKLLGRVRDGTVVILTVNDLRCIALIIQASTQRVSHLHLQSLDHEHIEKARVNLETHFRVRGSRHPVWSREEEMRTELESLLGMLWYDAVKPILTHLDFTEILPAEELPHITWCTTGPFSFLPIHAAGDYSTAEAILSNFAVSSYIPNLTGSSISSQPNDSIFSGILAVGHVSAVRGSGALPCAKSELDQIRTQFASLECTVLQDEEACVDSVLKLMAEKAGSISLAMPPKIQWIPSRAPFSYTMKT
ncbi:aromatic di-alanine and TPR containing protein [Ceratobasidium sp. AG-Ba]|nr:aromatic di-alanine and TPR containing protein [Ceratobasidium sp. AG-Ba]